MKKLIYIAAWFIGLVTGLILILVVPGSWECEGERAVTAANYSPDGQSISVLYTNGSVEIWQVNSPIPTLRWAIQGSAEQQSRVSAYSSDSKRVLISNPDGTTSMWDTYSGQLLFTLPGDNVVAYVAFSPDGQSLLTSSVEDTVRLWDVHNAQLRFTLQGSIGAADRTNFSPDGSMVLTSYFDANDTGQWIAQFWDAHSGQKLIKLQGESMVVAVSRVAFSPDSRLVAGSCEGKCDSTVHLWDTRSGHLLFALTGSTAFNGSLAFSPDGKTILTGGDNFTAIVWDVHSGQSLLKLQAHSDFITGVAFSPDSKTILTSSHDGTAIVWDAHNGQPLFAVQYRAGISRAAFSPDGKAILTDGDDGSARLWDAQTGQLLQVLCPHILSYGWLIGGWVLVIGMVGIAANLAWRLVRRVIGSIQLG